MLNYNVEVSLVGTLARKMSLQLRRWLAHEIYIIILVYLLLCGCKQQELLNHLDQQQAMMSLLFYKDIILMLRRRIKANWIFNLCRTNGFCFCGGLAKIYNLPGKPDIQISQMFPADHSFPLHERKKQDCILLLNSVRAISQNYGWHCFFKSTC